MATEASVPRPLTVRVRRIVLRTAVGLGAGAVLIVVFLRLVNIGAVARHLAHLNVGLALLCGVAFLAAFVVRALRWRCLLVPTCRVSVRRAVAIYQVAIFINWLLPVRGGELVKCLLLRRSDGVPISRSSATVSVDKAMDLLPAIGLLALVPIVHPRLSRLLWLLLLGALAVVTLGAVVLALAAWRREQTLALSTRLFGRLLSDRLRRRVEPFIVGFLDTLAGLLRQPRLILVAIAYTLVAVGLDALFCLLAFRAVGVAVALPVVVYGYTLYNLAYILPTPPGQIGSNELFGLLIFYGMFRVDRGAVGGMFLFSHPWTAILMTASGLACLSAMGLTLRGTMRLARASGGDEPG
jgi:uncharacterized protein (TIRG00374 family)